MGQTSTMPAMGRLLTGGDAPHSGRSTSQCGSRKAAVVWRPAHDLIGVDSGHANNRLPMAADKGALHVFE